MSSLCEVVWGKDLCCELNKGRDPKIEYKARQSSLTTFVQEWTRDPSQNFVNQKE